MKKTVWISYDLGVRGDYEGLYAWLDAHDAKECGDHVAILKYEFTDSLVESLTKDLEHSLELARHDRIYVTYQDPDSKTMKGAFIIGKRKAAPWSGYAGHGEQTDIAEA